MKKYIFLIIAAVSLYTTNAQELKWYSIEEAEQIQKDNPDKAMFIDIYTDWCGWCTKMDKTTFKDKEVVSFLNQYFIPVKLDAEYKKNINFRDKEFKFIKSGRRGINTLAYYLLNGQMSYPSYLVLNSDDAITHVMRGYMSPNDLLNRF